MCKIEDCKFWYFNQKTLIDTGLLLFQLKYQNYIHLIHTKVIDEVIDKRSLQKDQKI